MNPIDRSLLNHDAKLFASILARRLSKIITDYIHPDQAGFMPSRQLTGNIRRTLNIIDFCATYKIPSVVMAIDAEKAFERVETNYLLILLKKFSFGPGFLNALQALYTAPKAQIYVNNLRSDDFVLTRGTRQGCPLSPILFALSLEPLAEAIRADPNISGVQIASQVDKINLSADDTVLYLTQPERSLPSLFDLIHKFGMVSGYAIDQAGSAILLHPGGGGDIVKRRFG